jgi:membrane-anchored mycosin MYCP
MTRAQGWHRPVASVLLAAVCGVGWPGGVAGAAPQPDPPRRPVPPSSGCVPGSTYVFRGDVWAQQRLGHERVWPLTRGDGVTVAVLDTGVSAAAATLTGAVLPGADVVGTTGRADTDCTGHGTFVAGLIASHPVDGVRYAGIAPGARILPVRVSDPRTDGRDGVGGDAIARGIRAAVDAHADVIAVPVGTAFPTPELDAAVEDAVARGALVVAAVGTDPRGERRTYPAAHPKVLAVGPANDKVEATSGATGADRVDLVGPGANVVGIGISGNGHYIDDGAGPAVGFVAGTAALVRAYRPRLTPQQLAHRLVTTADPSGRPAAGNPLGNGIVDPYSAVASVLPEEGASGPAFSPVPASRVEPLADPRRDPRPARVAWTVAGGSFGMALCAALLWWTVRRRSRRGAGPEASVEDVHPLESVSAR